MRVIRFYNEYHLGDCFIHLHYLRKLVEKYDDIITHFYVNASYLKELREYISDDYYRERIQLFDLTYNPYDSINSWIGDTNYDINFHKVYTSDMNFDTFYVNFFKQLSKYIRLDCPIQNEYDMLLDNNQIKYRIFDKYDYLIVNSTPMSGQYPHDKIDPEFLKLIKKIEGKIITTKKIEGYESTLDHNLSLFGISQLSLYVKNVIAIHTSPVIPTFNKWSVNSIKRWSIIRKDKINYSYPNVYSYSNIKDVNI